MADSQSPQPNDAQRELEAQVAKTFEKAIDQRITAIVPLTDQEKVDLELDGFDGFNPTLVIMLQNGYGLLVTADPEGNGPGFLELLPPAT